MGRVTRRFRAFRDFLYALPCSPSAVRPIRARCPYEARTRLRAALMGDAGVALRSSAVGRRITDRLRGSPVGADGSAPLDRRAPARARRRPAGALPGGLHQGVGQESLPAGVFAAAVVHGADHAASPGAQRRDEGGPLRARPMRARRAVGPATRVGKRGRDRPPRCAAAGPVCPAPWRRTTRRTPWTVPSRPSPSPAWPRPAGARAPGRGPAPSSRPRRSGRPGR